MSLRTGFNSSDENKLKYPAPNIIKGIVKANFLGLIIAMIIEELVALHQALVRSEEDSCSTFDIY